MSGEDTVILSSYSKLNMFSLEDDKDLHQRSESSSEGATFKDDISSHTSEHLVAPSNLERTSHADRIDFHDLTSDLQDELPKYCKTLTVISASPVFLSAVHDERRNDVTSLCTVCLSPMLQGTAVIETRCKVEPPNFDYSPNFHLIRTLLAK